MPKNTPTQDDPGWFTVAQASRFLGVTPTGFRTCFLPDLPEEHVRREKPLLVYAPGVVELITIRAVRKATRGKSGDPLLDVPDSSPALERYRAARASLAELELRERENVLIPRDTVHAFLGVLANRTRRCGEQLQRHYGAGACKLLDDTLQNMQRLIDVWAGGPTPESKAIADEADKLIPYPFEE